MNKKQDGFTLIEGLLIVLILCVVGFAGYFVVSNNKDSKATSTTTELNDKTTQPTETPATTKDDPYKDWKTYTMKKSSVTFKYPSNWAISSKLDSSTTEYEKVSIIALDKSEIVLKLFSFQGGFSGDESSTTLDDVVEATNPNIGVSYAMLTYKTEGSYSVSYAQTASKGKYKVGDKFKLIPTLIAVKLTDGKNVNFSVAISGEGDEDFGKSKTFSTLDAFKKLESYQQAQKFLASLQIN